MTKPAAIVRLTASLLRELLTLPDSASVTACRVDNFREGEPVFEFRIEDDALPTVRAGDELEVMRIVDRNDRMEYEDWFERM